MPSHIRRLRDTLRTRLGGPTDSDVVGAPGSIQLRNVTAGYGGAPVFCRFDLHIDPGEFVYLVGPSGSGKSTLLKVLFGTVPPDEGWVTVDGIAVHRLQHWQTDTIRRRVGCVFQTYELLGHLTALENVLLPLQLAHPRTRHARAIAHQPRVLLADEPTGNVDKDASAEIMELFGQLNELLGSTVVMATHDEFVLTRYPARAFRLGPEVLEAAV